jgi:hypothetical protein
MSEDAREMIYWEFIPGTSGKPFLFALWKHKDYHKGIFEELTGAMTAMYCLSLWYPDSSCS